MGIKTRFKSLFRNLPLTLVVFSLITGPLPIAHAETSRTISGRFAYKSNGAPVSNVRLCFGSINPWDSPVDAVITDSNGSFSVNVYPDLYMVNTCNSNNTEDSKGIWPDFYADSSSLTVPPFQSYVIDARYGNVVQDLQIEDTSLINITLLDENDAPIPNVLIRSFTSPYPFSNVPYACTNLLVEHPEVCYGGGYYDTGTTDSSGFATLNAMPGQNAQICAGDASANTPGNPSQGGLHCLRVFNLVEGPNGVVISERQPQAPTLFAEKQVTDQAPNIGWNSESEIDHYDIYRDGHKLLSIPPYETIKDASASYGSHTYYVVAVNDKGNVSSPSNTVTIFRNDTVTPNLGTPTWTSNPAQQGQNTTLSIPATDNLGGNTTSVHLAWNGEPLIEADNLSGGVTGVQYSLNGDTSQSMTFDSASNTWRATFGSNLAVNTYNIAITATDQAGNTSTVNDVLAIYSSANGYVTGHAKTQPVACSPISPLLPCDTLPIAIDTSNNPAKLVLGFTNATAPTSGSFDLTYSIKNKQDEFGLSSTGINWIVVQDSTHASILGTADLAKWINGSQTTIQNVSVRFDISLSSNGNPDQVSVKIFNPGDNPATSTPAYTINNNVIPNGSNLMIHQ